MVIFDKSSVDERHMKAYSIWAAENGFCLDKPFLVIHQFGESAMLIKQGGFVGYVGTKFFTPFIPPDIEDCL